MVTKLEKPFNIQSYTSRATKYRKKKDLLICSNFLCEFKSLNKKYQKLLEKNKNFN